MNPPISQPKGQVCDRKATLPPWSPRKNTVTPEFTCITLQQFK